MTESRKKPRSYSAGKRKTAGRPSSVVRVYERGDVPGFFMAMAWHLTPSGRPVEEKLPDGTTWEYACATADAVASQRKIEVLAGRTQAGVRSRVTLSDLWKRYLESAEASGWSDKHRADYERARSFWLDRLGAGRVVQDLTLAEIEKVAREARTRQKLSPRWEKRKLSLLRATVRWGCRKAKLYPLNPLEGLEMPDYEPETDDLIYSEEETAALIQPHPDVDWRATLAANIAVDTGRRISAILHLAVDDVRFDGERVFLQFRKDYDKAKRGALRPVSFETAQLLAEALQRPEVEESGWILPEGRLDFEDPRDKPLGKKAAIVALHHAEHVLGVERVHGRAYHGLKRRHVTTAMEVSHGDASLVGDQTGNVSAELIQWVYRKASSRRLTGHVDRVRGALKEAESTRESTRAEGEESEPPQNTASQSDVSELARVDSNHHRRFQRPVAPNSEGAEDG